MLVLGCLLFVARRFSWGCCVVLDAEYLAVQIVVYEMHASIGVRVGTVFRV